jgi:hypothetical protein
MAAIFPRFAIAGAGLFFCAHPLRAVEFTVTAANHDAQVGKDASSFQPAVVNSIYTIPSWGKTGDESSLTISFNAENRFRLLPDSEAEVKIGDDDSGSAWHRVVSLKIGKAALSHDTGTAPTVKLDCETPTAVCGAVGTEFEVDATAGNYSVSSGQIAVSSDQEGALSLTSGEGGAITYNPGRENTYAHGSFTGTVRLNGASYHASDCTFTVAKILDSSGETAVHVASGSFGDLGPGDYVSDGGGLKPVDPKLAAIHPQYLAAAEREGLLNVERASYRSANRTPPARDAGLADAAAEATALRKKLFNRETIRETVKQQVQQVTNQAAQQAAQAAAAAAQEAARSAVRPGR